MSKNKMLNKYSWSGWIFPDGSYRITKYNEHYSLLVNGKFDQIEKFDIGYIVSKLRQFEKDYDTEMFYTLKDAAGFEDDEDIKIIEKEAEKFRKDIKIELTANQIFQITKFKTNISVSLFGNELTPNQDNVINNIVKQTNSKLTFTFKNVK